MSATARRWLLRAAAVPLGAAATLVLPAAGWWWFAWVALVPPVLLVARASDRRDAVWRAWAAGSGYFLGVFHWVLAVLGPFTPLPALALGATWIPVGLVLWATLGRDRDVGPGQVAAALVVVPSVWVLTEFVRSWHLFAGSWGQLGLSQWQVDSVRQLAALGGVWAVSWLLVAVNVGLAAAVLGPTATARVAGAAVPAVLVAVSVLWGAARAVPPTEDVLRVAGVQPGRIDGPARRLDANERLTRTLDPAAQGIDLVVWGQSSVGFDPAGDAEVRARLEGLAASLGVPLMVNVDARRADGGIAKSSLLIDPDDGVVASYDKQRLVPFGEYVPFRSLLGWLDRYTDAEEEDRVPGGELTVSTSGTRPSVR